MTEKYCPKCKMTKPVSEFSKNVRRSDGLQGNCTKCKKVYAQQHYQKDKQAYVNRAAASKSNLRAEIRKIKSDTPCADCKQQFPYYVMQFDHISDKIDNVADILRKTTSRKQVLAEIAKCEVVCANCHAIRTWTRIQ